MVNKKTVKDLALELGVKELDIRKAARKLFGKPEEGKWLFNNHQADWIRKFIMVKPDPQLQVTPVNKPRQRNPRSIKETAVGPAVPALVLEEIAAGSDDNNTAPKVTPLADNGKTKWVLVELPYE